MASSKIEINKFNGNRFNLWKFQLTKVLRAKKLLRGLDESNKPTESKESEKWTEDDDLVQMIIVNSMEYDELEHI